MALRPSELILNEDGSIYHLNLLPQDLAHTIITVGDPERVAQVSACFDTVELRKGKREFHTHTGRLKGKRLTVISTGIGTDNIDIVLNELDALVNLDFGTKQVKKNHIRLNIVRIGTSGTLHGDILVDSFLMSEYTFGLDGLWHYYAQRENDFSDWVTAFVEQCRWPSKMARPYLVPCDPKLKARFASNHIRFGVTATSTGFYGPQGRSLRLGAAVDALTGRLAGFSYKGHRITNLEMETSGIYALAGLLGHRAISLNCILANRANGTFSKKPTQSVQNLIEYTLDKLTQDETR
ncbi:nucleoside phosphorylase [Maribacter sp. 2307ULW6-5]|uniref:nucleoside phosphorylase n=1 Tax=Maribacter sp. 2307ULW6-5 TaxID=3386275 RepID=UPI0039BC2A83